MSEGPRLPIEDVDGLVRSLQLMLGPAWDIPGIPRGSACVKVQVCGSYRRREATIGDVDIVALPHYEMAEPVEVDVDHQCEFAEFATPRQRASETKTPEPACPTYPVLTRLLRYYAVDHSSWPVDVKPELAGFLIPVTDGPKTKTFIIGYGEFAGVKVGLYIADEFNFGDTMLLRTGHHKFSKAMFSSQKVGGLLPPHLRHREGYLEYSPSPVATPERVKCGTEADYFRIAKIPYIEPWRRTPAAVNELRRELGLPPVSQEGDDRDNVNPVDRQTDRRLAA